MIAVYIVDTSESNVVRENVFCENSIDYNDWGKYNQIYGNNGCPSPIIPGYNIFWIIFCSIVSILIISSKKFKKKQY